MPFLQELAEILHTTESNAEVRAKKMNLYPVCTRCMGSGRYSFNGSHSICYKCNGDRCQLPSKNEVNDLLDRAREAVANGELDKYLEYLKANKIVNVAIQTVMDAWKATGISDQYNWRNAFGPGLVQKDADISAINRKMSNAYDRVTKATYALKSGTPGYQEDVINLAKLVDTELETIRLAKIEMDEYLSKEIV